LKYPEKMEERKKNKDDQVDDEDVMDAGYVEF
jgi:hypothetical protein